MSDERGFTKGNIIAIIAVILTGVGVFTSWFVFDTQRCDNAINDALEYHTNNRGSKDIPIEQILSSKFKIAAKICGSNSGLYKVLKNWHEIPERCSGNVYRGKEICDDTEEVLKLLDVK